MVSPQATLEMISWETTNFSCSLDEEHAAKNQYGPSKLLSWASLLLQFRICYLFINLRVLTASCPNKKLQTAKLVPSPLIWGNLVPHSSLPKSDRVGSLVL